MTNELYAEATAKRKVTAGVIVLKVIAIVIILMIFAMSVFMSGLIGSFMPMLGGVAVVLLIWYWPRFKTEWEYVFCDGQLDFDMILGGQKRKSVLRVEIEEADLIAKMDSDKMNNYRHLNVKDFTSLRKGVEVYGIVTKSKEEKVIILFEPTPKMLDMMYTKCPNIVKI